MFASKCLTKFGSTARFFASRRNSMHFSNVHDTVASHLEVLKGRQWVTDFPLMIYQMSSDGVQALGEYTKKCAGIDMPLYTMHNGIIAEDGS